MTTLIKRRMSPAIIGSAFFDEIFNEFFVDPQKMIKNSTSGYPVTDIYTNEKGSQIIEMALAGFKKSDLKVNAEDNTITISCDTESNSGNSPRRIAKRKFKKTFVDYHNQLDFSKTKADFIDGLLKIEIPKIESKKKITINIM